MSSANPDDAALVAPDVLEATLRAALRGGGEFAEVFVEDRWSSSARLDDGRVEELVTGRDRGAGIRVVHGPTTGFAHTADLAPSALAAAAESAAAAARAGGATVRAVALGALDARRAHPVIEPPAQVPKARRVELLRVADEAARSEGAAVRQVSAACADSHRRTLVASSDGVHAADEQVRTRCSVQVVAAGDTGMQTGSEAPGRSVGFELFDEVDVAEVARTAARRALTLLGARPAPTGRLPVVLRRGAGGVLFHEACGHGLEADHVAKDASVFRGRTGERVAARGVTLVDDGTYPREWGTYAFDDEGHAARRNVLIRDGILDEYLWDVVRAREEGRVPSGNGRRQSYRHLPLPRMTNTYVEAGTVDPDDIVADTPEGLYCVQLGGGQVDTATGDFVFGITEAYLIEGGRITAPVQQAQLVGNGPAALLAIDAVGSDFETWTGTCGKQGQGVPVSAGQPSLRVHGLTVGGTAGG